MKEVKWLLGVLLGAGYASSWWATAFSPQPFVLIPIFSTIALVILSIVYCIANWGNE